MTGSLKVPIVRPLLLHNLLESAAECIRLILRADQNFKICWQIPRGAPFDEVPAMIPILPRWGLYLYIEDVEESLVEAHLSTVSTEAREERVVLYFRELRTPASKVLTVGLAIAAGELSGQDVLDAEHVWIDQEQMTPAALREHLTISKPQATLQSALDAFVQKMNRPC
jgi:hypothetical protein